MHRNSTRMERGVGLGPTVHRFSLVPYGLWPAWAVCPTFPCGRPCGLELVLFMNNNRDPVLSTFWVPSPVQWLCPSQCVSC
jgi:hypothetical protein